MDRSSSMPAASAGEPTRVYQDRQEPPGDLARPHPVRLVPGSTPHLSGEIQTLLRKRLRVAFAIIALVLGAGVPLALLNIRLIDRPLPDIVWPTVALIAVMAVVAAAAALVLGSKRPLSLKQLRAVELILVGMGVLMCVWRQSNYLEGAGLFERFGDDLRIDVLAGYHSLYWVAFLAIYALFVPNTWRRCAVVVGVIALCPFVVLAVDVSQPDFPLDKKLLVVYLTVLGLWMFFGVGLALSGSHHIGVLRREAREARKLGQYRLKQHLGSGGMGEVYLAEHALLKRPCAVKVIRPEQTGDPKALERFEREVQATAALSHPNVVEIYDYGRADDGTFYYVMEYLAGLSLEELVKRHGPLPPARAVHLLRQVCAALREAHAAGLIHRDIKPANVFVCRRGGLHDLVKLLDFGLVRTPVQSEKDPKLTQEGTIAGTPAYMSPEQATGVGDLDGRSDLYSLGTVGYFLLTGRPPFVRQSAVQTLAAHLGEPVPSVASARADVPADLEAVVLRCLEKEPGRRYQNADDLEQALAQCSSADQWTRERAETWWVFDFPAADREPENQETGEIK